MAAVAVTAHVTGLCATIWWRRAAARLGRPGTLLLVLAVPVAFVGFYAWAWGQVSPIMATMSSNEALAELLLSAAKAESRRANQEEPDEQQDHG
mgnify:CR=1 FL=1